MWLLNLDETINESVSVLRQADLSFPRTREAGAAAGWVSQGERDMLHCRGLVRPRTTVHPRPRCLPLPRPLSRILLLDPPRSSMHLKGALHVHTTCSDGELTIAQAAAVYKEFGFDFIALTDHDYLLRPTCYDTVRHMQTDLIIFTGVEMTVFQKGYVHISRLDGDKEVLHIFNHPSELNLPVEKVRDLIATVARDIPIDAVEITSKGFRTPEYDVPEIPYPKVATDDSHTKLGCGRAWVEMDCMRDRDKIIRAIKHGDFWNCYAG